MPDEMPKSADTPSEKPVNGLLRGNSAKMSSAEKAELTKKVAAWFYQDPKLRQPRTLPDLAKELKKSPNTIRTITRNLPETQSEYIDQLERHSLARYIEALDSLIDTAVAGKKDSVAAFRQIREIARDHAKVKQAKAIEMPSHVMDALEGVIEAKRKAREKTRNDGNKALEQAKDSTVQ